MRQANKIRNLGTAATTIADLSRRIGLWKRIPKSCRHDVGRYMQAHAYLVKRSGREKHQREGIRTVLIPTVQIFLFRNSPQGVQVYLGKRATGNLRGQWSVPGGRRDEGESFAQAAIRELSEETGLNIQDSDLFPIGPRVTNSIKEEGDRKINYEYRVRAYAVWADDMDPMNASDEHDITDWMLLSEAIAMNDRAIQKSNESGGSSLENAIPDVALGVIKEFKDYATTKEAAKKL